MALIQNPWLALDASGPPYFLEADREYICGHNERCGPQYQLMVNALPEPFIGDPETAKVVLLNLNPGFDHTAEQDHRRPEIKEAIFRNLRRESRDYPFYAFDPLFEGTGVAKYWRQYTRRLQKEAGLNDYEFGQRLLVIEWFPYASSRGGLPAKPVCPSQEYSFQLAREMLTKPEVQVLGTRALACWRQAGSEFSRVPFLLNPQRPWITRGNMNSDLFDRLLRSLKEGA